MPKPPFVVDCNLYFTWESPPVFLQSAGKCGMVGSERRDEDEV
nr:MAG TPA: hypothetical protein [Caudoviricetes sp.]